MRCVALRCVALLLVIVESLVVVDRINPFTSAALSAAIRGERLPSTSTSPRSCTRTYKVEWGVGRVKM